jgi:DNA-binding transcriptional LysR family regulator
MNDRLLALKLFVRIAHTGSFSRAGKDLKLSQPSASRLIASLEREVGAALFTRSTRAVVLTEAGSDYFARVEPALAILEEAGQAIHGKGALRGILRIGLPASMAIREVIPRLPAFIAKHPALRIDFAMDDGRQDLIRDAIDVAIRSGKLEDSSATLRRVGSNPLLIAASPAYLKRAGRPMKPDDLSRHPVLIGVPGSNGICSFKKDGRTVSVKVEAPLSGNINEAAVAGGVAGIGIVACSLWGCRAELKSGALVQILKDWDMGAADVNAIFPAGRGAKLAARAFVEHFTKDLKAHP